MPAGGCLPTGRHDPLRGMELVMADSRFGSLYSRLPDNTITAKCDGKTYKHPVPTRDEKRWLIEVEVTPTNGIAIAGQHVRQGTSRLVVYETDLPDIEARVATDQHKSAWNAAVSTYNTALNRYITSTIGKDDGSESYRLRKEQAAKMFGETTPSLEFSRNHAGGMPPIAKLTKLEELKAPETETNRDATRLEQLVTKLAETLGKAMAASQQSSGARANQAR